MKLLKTHTLLCVMIAFLFVGCSSGVVPMGRDTYMISGSQPGLIGTGTVRARLLREADQWCRTRGLVMVPVSYTGSDAIAGQKMANAEVIFRAVSNSDYENKRPTFERGPDHHELITIRRE
jgi:hypothetical protein